MSQCKVCHQQNKVFRSRRMYSVGLSPVGECHSVRFVTSRRMSQCKVCHQEENVTVLGFVTSRRLSQCKVCHQ